MAEQATFKEDGQTSVMVSACKMCGRRWPHGEFCSDLCETLYTTRWMPDHAIQAQWVQV